ncbi:MAG: acyl-CoA dehydratase activase [Bacillota bacterium]
MEKLYLGIDVGSVSTDAVLIDPTGQVVAGEYLLTKGNPVRAIQEALASLRQATGSCAWIAGCGTTGSGRVLASIVCGADVVRNEITCHALAAIHQMPSVRTIIEIGGQDSKIIILSNSVVVDFAMNSVCAAGTGSFLDRQAARLGISIEQLGELALKSTNPVRIAGRCAVFAESDMIHKQQAGHPVPDILKGLCNALVLNYMATVARGKQIRPPVFFQGGVAANVGIRRSFEEYLGFPVVVPPHFKLMGAIGAALLALRHVRGCTNFRGFEVADRSLATTGFQCEDCANGCEIVELRLNGQVQARWGSQCGKWNLAAQALPELTQGLPFHT